MQQVDRSSPVPLWAQVLEDLRVRLGDGEFAERFPTEQMAHVAARNIASQIAGEAPTEHKEFGDMKAVCVMDAGNNGVIILADHMLPPHGHSVMIPGPQAHAMKVAFEKYFMWKAKHGHVALP